MANQNQNGRNVALPDENRPSWRPQDQSTRGRGMDRDDRDEDRGIGRGSRHGGMREMGSYDDDRDEGYRSAERYGQGQSGYGSGRQGDDRSMQGFQNRNQMYGGPYSEDRQQGIGVDDRYSGRGGQGYWQDRGGSINQDRQFGGGRGFEEQQRYGGQRDRGFGGAESQGYNSGYNQGGYQGGGFGGYGEQGQQRWGNEGFGSQGMPQGHTGGYGSQGYGQQSSQGGRSGQWGQGHQGMDQQRGYGSQSPYGGKQQPYPGQRYDEPQQRGPHRGKGPQGWQRSDERIKDMVCEVLTDDEHIDASNIDITVKQGEVTLTGSVPDRQTKRLAEDVVERVSGVKDVLNQIRVQGEQRKSEPESQVQDKKHRA